MYEKCEGYVKKMLWVFQSWEIALILNENGSNANCQEIRVWRQKVTWKTKRRGEWDDNNVMAGESTGGSFLPPPPSSWPIPFQPITTLHYTTTLGMFVNVQGSQLTSTVGPVSQARIYTIIRLRSSDHMCSLYLQLVQSDKGKLQVD